MAATTNQSSVMKTAASTAAKLSESSSSSGSSESASLSAPQGTIKDAKPSIAAAPPAKVTQQKLIAERVSDIIIPNHDHRRYRALMLANAVRVLLISDPETDRSAAAMCVGVGSLSDPADRQGLAHALEHALFLASRKYSDCGDNFFKRYVTQRGGTTNACTSPIDTIYYFDVAPAFLHNSLDRFASVFAAPAFPGDSIARELGSLQSEFESKFTDDSVRCERVRKLAGDPKHAYAKFDYGNKATLCDGESGDLVAAIRRFYDAYYSANNMGLAVYGRESLEQLEQMIAPLFGRLANRRITMPLFREHPYSPPYCGKWIRIVPFGEVRRLILFFPISYTVTSNGLDFVVAMLAHEGPRGLIAELKRRALCTAIYVRAPYYHGFGFLDIEVDLTQGVTANHEIIALVFRYLHMLKTSTQLKNAYDEVKAIKNIKFHYRERSEPLYYVMNLCANLHVSLERCVLGRSFPEFSLEDIHAVLDRLTPENLTVQIVSPIFRTEPKHNFVIDPIFGIQYSIDTISSEDIAKWKAQSSAGDGGSEFALPSTNEFIPQSFVLKQMPGISATAASAGDQHHLQQQCSIDPSSASAAIPTIVGEFGDRIRVWHLQDAQYRIPKAYYGFFFASSLAQASPAHQNAITLFIKLFYDTINQRYYDARLVTGSFALSTNKFGLELTVNGYDDKLDRFAFALLRELRQFAIDAARFEVCRDIHRNQLRTFGTWTIKNLLNHYLDELITPNVWSYASMLRSLDAVTIDLIAHIVFEIVCRSRIEMMAHGNVTRGEAIDLANRIAALFNEPLSSKQGATATATTIPDDPILVFDATRDTQLPIDILYQMAVQNVDQETNGFLLYYQIGPEELPLRAKLELFHQLIYFQFFDQIRTREQLGYVVAINFKYTWSGTLGLYTLLQTSYDVDHIESRIDAFMSNAVPQILSATSGNAFEKAKQALAARLAETPKLLFWHSSKLWSEITTGQYVFDRNRRLLREVRAIENIGVIENFYREYFCVNASNASQCRRLLITIKGGKCRELPRPIVDSKEEAQANKCANDLQPKQTNDASTAAAAAAGSKSPTQKIVGKDNNNNNNNNNKNNATNVDFAEKCSVATTSIEKCSGSTASSSSSLKNDSTAEMSGQPKRVTIANIRKFKCENNQWRISKIVTDNFA